MGKHFGNLSNLFSNGNTVESEFSLKHKGLLIQDCVEIANVFNKHFNTITDSLNLFYLKPAHLSNFFIDPVLQAVDKFKDHPCIVKIRSFTDRLCKFQFREVTMKEVTKLVMKLDGSKKTEGVISTKTLKASIGITAMF